MSRILRIPAAIVFLAWANALVSGQGQPIQDVDGVYVGVLQDDRQELAAKGPNDFAPAHNRSVVTAFGKIGGQWKQLDRLNEKVNWTVAFDGKKLGEIESTPQPFPEVGTPSTPVDSPTYLRAVHTILTRPDRIPSMGGPQGKFNGAFETIVRRPLVVVSKANFQDPDNWKPGTVPVDLAKPIQSEFERVYQNLRECGSDGEPLKHNWKLPDSGLAIVKTYRSTRQLFLVETHVKGHKCLFSENGTAITDLGGTQWFFVDDKKSVRFLGNDWDLVDAGDYDGNGKSELIFFFGEPFNGREEYILFYDDFRSHVTWSYP